jgi:pimeloyl-ACP methyl ester carboxylesterase
VGFKAEQQRSRGFPGRIAVESAVRYRAASPMEMIPLKAKQRVIHGDRDDVVPISMTRAYVEAARKSGDDCTLTEPPGAGHFELIDPRTAAWGQVRDTIIGLL